MMIQNGEQDGADDSGPVGDGAYVVRRGDCLSSIAKAHGHIPETIWEHTANRALQDAGREPNVLLPGDRLLIPPIRLRSERGDTENHYRFVRHAVPERLWLCFLEPCDNEEERPRSGVRFVLDVDGHLTEGTLDADGAVRISIPPDAQRVVMRLEPEDEPAETYEVALGTVDPATSLSGVQDRLNNLGFRCGRVDGYLNDRTRHALRNYQRKHGLEETGEPDQTTRDRLVAEHGS